MGMIESIDINMKVLIEELNYKKLVNKVKIYNFLKSINIF